MEQPIQNEETLTRLLALFQLLFCSKEARTLILRPMTETEDKEQVLIIPMALVALSILDFFSALGC